MRRTEATAFGGHEAKHKPHYKHISQQSDLYPNGKDMLYWALQKEKGKKKKRNKYGSTSKKAKQNSKLFTAVAGVIIKGLL